MNSLTFFILSVLQNKNIEVVLYGKIIKMLIEVFNKSELSSGVQKLKNDLGK